MSKEQMNMQQAEQVTVADLNEHIETYVRLGQEKDAIEETLSAKNKEIAAIKGKIVAYLKDLNMEDYRSPLASVSIRQKWSVKMPANDMDRKAFYDYLRERGIFESMVSVNYQTLNSFYNTEIEIAKQKGEFLEIPGIAAPTLFEDLSAPRVRKN